MSWLKKIMGAASAAPAASASAAPSLDAQLRHLATAFAMPGLDKQTDVLEQVGDADWQADLDTQRLRFSNGLDCRVQAIGSYSFQSNTWLWSWANTQADWPQAVMADARALADYGRAHHLPLLQADQATALPQEALHLLGCAASSLCGADGYYLAHYGSGALLCNLYLPDTAARPAASLPSVRALSIIPQAISLFEMDHRPALQRYLAGKGFALQESAQQITATPPGGAPLQARFNEQGLLQSLSGSAGQD